MKTTRKMTTMAMLTALSVVLVAIIHFPIIPVVPFLEYDPADIPILLSTFLFGPIAGLCITVVASLIQGLTVSAQSGWYGIIMHIIATGSYVLVAGFIYYGHKDKKRAVIAMICATLAAVVVMIIANLFITPFFMGAPREAVVGLLLPGIIPFNLIKFVVNGIITFFIYKPISNLVKHPSKKKEKNNCSTNL